MYWFAYLLWFHLAHLLWFHLAIQCNNISIQPLSISWLCFQDGKSPHPSLLLHLAMGKNCVELAPKADFSKEFLTCFVTLNQCWNTEAEVIRDLSRNYDPAIS